MDDDRGQATYAMTALEEAWLFVIANLALAIVQPVKMAVIAIVHIYQSQCLELLESGIVLKAYEVHPTAFEAWHSEG